MMCSDGRSCEDRGDEGAVDLELVELELAQAPERGLAGAEIVERDADAAALQIADDLLAPRPDRSSGRFR